MIACIVIASEHRKALVLDKVLPTIVGFDEAVLVGDWPQDADYGVRYLYVEPLLRTTTDALIKRDAGALATVSDVIVYLCDDHALGPEFGLALRQVLTTGPWTWNLPVMEPPWDVIVPNRCTYLKGTRYPLNMGEAEGYCGGHAGVFRRSLIQALPWTAGPHDRLWDLHMSQRQQALGATFIWRPRSEIEIIDLEPERKPWK